jgi:tetratricopeptide (TPR) repeat protein
MAQRCAALGHRSIDLVEAELPQVYAAILHAQADGPAAQTRAVALAVALRRHWEVDTRAGPPLAVLRALEAALPAAADAQLRCEVCLLLAISFVLAGLAKEGSHFADQALALAVHPRERSWALSRRSNLRLFSSGDLSDVDACMAEALALAKETGDLEGQALALRVRFLLATNRDDDPDQGERLAHQMQLLWERVGHRRNAYGSLMDRASCWIKQGRLDEAASALAACEQAAIQERYATGSIMSSWQLGRVSMKLRQSGTALAAYRRCLQQSWELKRLAYTADALVLVPSGLAFSSAQHDVENAARLFGFAVPHWERNFGAIYRELGRDLRHTRRWLFHRLGPVHFDTLRMEGACMSLPEAVALGLGA